MKPSIFRRSLAYIAGALAAASLALLLSALYVSDRIILEANSAELSKTALLAAAFLGEAPPSQDHARMIASATGYRVTLVEKGGRVLADSSTAPFAMESHGGRPEIREAFLTGNGAAARISETTGKRTLYAAVAAGPKADPYALRLALPLPGLGARIGESALLAISFLAVLSVLSLAASLALKRHIALPLAQLARKAEAYLGGTDKLDQALAAVPAEMAVVDQALDKLVQSVKERTQESRALGARLASILEAAGEGIVAADEDLRIVEANTAAAKLFSRSINDLIGKPLGQATSSRESEKIFLQCMESRAEISKTIILFREGARRIQVHAAPFSWAGNSGGGVVAVFADITELDRLEKVRKEFVANVSHELRTPIQIIRGYAELLSASSTERDATGRYLALIEANAKRMERIVGDLLSLARLEDEGASRAAMESAELKPVLQAACDAVSTSAARKSISIRLDCPADLSLVMNAGLMEQAVFNILDNAVAYSPESSTVDVDAFEAEGTWAVIKVRDRGMGIPAADLPRIFERFYRVDKSRSKETGGTGLGLSIVKHIVQIHGGEVSAESFLNEGSTFQIKIPTGARRAAEYSW